MFFINPKITKHMNTFDKEEMMPTIEQAHKLLITLPEFEQKVIVECIRNGSAEGIAELHGISRARLAEIVNGYRERLYNSLDK